MSFRLVSISGTLDDPERRNRPNYSPNRSVISPNSVALRGADYVKVVEDTQILSATRNLFISRVIKR